MKSNEFYSPLCNVKLELMETKCDTLRSGSECENSRPNYGTCSLAKVRKGISLPMADTYNEIK